MKVITASYDGHVNSVAFKSWDEARTFVVSRIPEEAFIQKTDEYWTKYVYLEKRGKKYIEHVWELNEIELVRMGSC